MDRGLMDVQAYLNADQWKSILDANNMTEDMMAERSVPARVRMSQLPVPVATRSRSRVHT